MRTAFFHNFLIESTLISSVAIILMIIIRKTIRRQIGNKAVVFGWLLIAARLLVPISIKNPWINMIRSPTTPDIAIRPIAGQVLVRVRDTLLDVNSNMLAIGNKSQAELTENLIDSINSGAAGLWLFRIYIAGIVLIVGWFVFSNIRFNRKIRMGKIETISGKLLDQYETICLAHEIKPIPVILTDPLPSACLLGTFHPYIALPLTVSPTEMPYVLEHEICHLKHRDHLWSLLRLVCCAVHWFNPLVWLAADMSRADIEMRCDDSVVKPMTNEQKKTYVNILLQATARRNAPGIFVLATGMTMAGRKLKTRVMTVLKGGNAHRRLTFTFCLLASVCLVLSFATSELPGQVKTFEKWSPHFIADTLTGNIALLDVKTAAQYADVLHSEVLGGCHSECIATVVGTQYQINGTESDTLIDWQMRVTDSGIVLDYSKKYPDQGIPVDLDEKEILVHKHKIEQVRSYLGPIIEHFLPGLDDRIEYLALDSIAICNEIKYYSFSMRQIDGVNDYVFITVRELLDGTMNVVSFSADGNG